MKKLLLLSLLIAFFHSLNAQNYRTIQTQETPLFQYNHDPANPDDYGSYLDWITSPTAILISLKSDSVFVSNGDTTFYHHRILTQDNSLNCNSISDTAWFGSKTILRNDGFDLYFPQAGDTIWINTQANINESWRFYTTDTGSYFEATVFSIQEETVLGVQDSVKTFGLVFYDASGMVQSHFLDNYTLKISQNYGWIRTIDFNYFPNDTSQFVLDGTTKHQLGNQMLTAEGIFDYDIGDVFHKVHHTADFNFDPYSYTDYIREEILGKTTTLNGVDYTVARYQVSHNAEDQVVVFDTIIIYDDTITVSIDYDTYEYLSLPTFHAKDFADELPLYSVLIESDFTNRLARQSDNELTTLEDTCWSIWSGPCFISQMHVEGLGGPYEKLANCFTGAQYYTELRYFKKGTETWGTPLSFDLLTNTKPTTINHYSLQVFPNPATTTLRLQLSENSIGDILIYNQLGQVVFSENNITLQSKQSFTLNIGDLEQGIFVLEYRTKERRLTKRFLKY